MSRAQIVGVAAFLALAAAAFAAFAGLPGPLRWFAALGLGAAAIALPGYLFARLASEEERRRDLEERVRDARE